MAGRKLPRLSEAQLELMSIIWRKDKATVTEVWESLPRGRHIARTTVMTVLARLAKKGWLRRRKSGNEYVYSPAVGREKALGGMLSRLIDTAFGGSTEGLIMTLVNARGISEEEAERLRRIIDGSAGGDR
ncbi:MAG: BlaI/MecI/CopY family transcriptional regulator [Planctomycetota bacterium]|jgi:predicted transcriptional regulator